MTAVSLAVEGLTDIPVAARLVRLVGAEPVPVLVANGKSRLDPIIPGLNDFAVSTNWLDPARPRSRRRMPGSARSGVPRRLSAGTAAQRADSGASYRSVAPRRCRRVCKGVPGCRQTPPLPAGPTGEPQAASGESLRRNVSAARKRTAGWTRVHQPGHCLRRGPPGPGTGCHPVSEPGPDHPGSRAPCGPGDLVLTGVPGGMVR